jgi:hypothetical protein
MDWEAEISLICEDNEVSGRLRQAMNSLGVAAQPELYMPANPADGGVRWRTRAIIAAGDERELEALVRERYASIFPIARSWECEAEAGDLYAHFEGVRSDYDDVAAEFDDVDEPVEAEVPKPQTPSGKSADEQDDESVPLSSRMSAFLDAD